MSGTLPTSPTPAEHHLGDRLAALVDGELGHDARERVLAHLATCARCKAEADAQRTLKSVFASAAPPPPSEGFLARLQGLPGGPGGPSGDPGAPGDPGGLRRTGGPKSPLEELLGARGVRSDGFATAAVVTPHPGRPVTGFRIHEVGDRAPGSGGRGRRFAFAAASAVSFAAIALGGTLPLDASVSAGGRGAQGTGSTVTPLRTTTTGGTGTGTSPGRGTRSGERTGAQAVAAEPLVAITPAAVPQGPVAAVVPLMSGRSFTPPLVAVGLSYPPSRSLLPLSPFVRQTGPVLPPASGPGPSPAPSPTTAPLGSPR
ncbi:MULTISPECIES: anti-sigma factor family protein [unclassified Streptomyces]|uniref:anti-sigma factor family protein n=1 Tax=unclassified Streptomyces TaxID=2593676 RepID=UPI0007C76485|nr:MULTISPECIES: anti-sigma factor [unclassified Streptomyces]